MLKRQQLKATNGIPRTFGRELLPSVIYSGNDVHDRCRSFVGGCDLFAFSWRVICLLRLTSLLGLFSTLRYDLPVSYNQINVPAWPG